MKEAIKFWNNNGEDKVLEIINGDLAGAQLYHPKTKHYYQSHIGVLYWYSWEDNRYIKLNGFIELSEMISIDDLKTLLSSHEYMREYGDIEVAEAALRSLQVSARVLDKNLANVRACRDGVAELTAVVIGSEHDGFSAAIKYDGKEYRSTDEYRSDGAVRLLRCQLERAYKDKRFIVHASMSDGVHKTNTGPRRKRKKTHNCSFKSTNYAVELP